MSDNPTYIKLIHSQRWLNLRKMILTKHPICQECERKGIITPSKEIHHIVPVERGVSVEDMQGLCYDPHNLMALCHQCHVDIHTQMGKSGKKQRAEQTKGQLERIKEKFFS